MVNVGKYTIPMDPMGYEQKNHIKNTMTQRWGRSFVEVPTVQLQKTQSATPPWGITTNVGVTYTYLPETNIFAP